MLALILLVGINLDDFDQPYSVEMAKYLVGEIELNSLQFRTYAQGQEEEYKRIKFERRGKETF